MEDSYISENNENDTKINLIKEEITDKNYNQLDFMNFCLFKRRNGDDIDNWTLEELSSLVKEFQQNNFPQEGKLLKEENKIRFNINKINNYNRMNREEKKGEENYNYEDEIDRININNLYKEKEINKAIKDDKEEGNNRKYKIIYKNGKREKIIKCKKLEKTVLNNENIIINLKNPIEISGGMFSKNYILYTIETQPMGWIVQRKYNDFELLRKLLLKFYPFYKIDLLPTKKLGSNKSEPNIIEKKMKYLELFINNIVKHESFKASDILFSFLSFEDRNQFDNKFKELTNKIFENKNVFEFKTLNGELSILHDEKNENYFHNIHEYLKLQNEVFIKLNQNLKLFNKNMEAISGNMNEIIDNFNILHNLNSNVLMKETITNSYVELKKLFKGWKKIIDKQNNIVKDRIKNLFKYINLTNNAYREVIEKREELNNKFKTENSKLIYKKEKLFLYGDINKFEIDKDQHVDMQRLIKDKKYTYNMICTKETQNLSDMYKLLGYANKRSITELKKMIMENCNKFKEILNKFNEEFYPTINEFIEILNNFDFFLKNKKRNNKKINIDNKIANNDVDINIINFINNNEKIDNNINNNSLKMQ